MRRRFVIIAISVIAGICVAGAVYYNLKAVNSNYGLPQTAEQAAEQAADDDASAATGGTTSSTITAATAGTTSSTTTAATATTSAYDTYDKLSVPTYISRIGDDYFIVDCYNDQIIYSSELNAPLSKWKVMTDDISKGHTVVSDGKVYLADDTENNRVLVFVKKDSGFEQIKTFDNIGNKPHYMQYDAATDTFYCWSSFTDEMYLFKRDSDSDNVRMTGIKKIDGLENRYIRSFMIAGDLLYVVSGIPISQTDEKPYIYCCDLESFSVLDRFEVPDELAGMAQIMAAGDYFYITVSTDLAGSQDVATIIRTTSLQNLADKKYEDIYSKYFAGGGTPYYMGCIDGKYYLTEHRLSDHALWSFDISNNEITNVKSLF